MPHWLEFYWWHLTGEEEMYKKKKSAEALSLHSGIDLELQNTNKDIAENVNKKPPSLLWDLLFVLLKIGIIILVFVAIFTFIYGAFRCDDPSMSPAIKDGDLVVYYRLDKNYVLSDVAAIEENGHVTAKRVVAESGDTVDITEDGKLIVNGAIQQETSIYEDTYRYEEGIDFPVTLKEGEIFLLGDARENSTDSRIYGPVQEEDTLGKVIIIFRRRGI